MTSLSQVSSQEPLDFSNTAIAFQSRSTASLRKAKVLFEAFNYPSLIALGPKLANVAFGLKLPIEPLIRLTVFDYFCGGVTIADCKKTVAWLGRYQVRSILDYSVEGLGQERDFEATTDETLRTIAVARGDSKLPFAVFKVTGLARFELLEKISRGDKLTPGEQSEFERVEGRVMQLAKATQEAGLRLLVDAEESWIQPAIDQLAEKAMRVCNRDRAVVYNTLQMYRVDRLAYLADLHQRGKTLEFRVGVKLVRGAYMEKERARAQRLGVKSPIQPNKAATDRDFNLALEFTIKHLGDIELFAGTHNEDSTKHLTELMHKYGIERHDRRIEFSQLLGMSDHLTFNLAHHGYMVSKYVPYGPVKAVIPYLVRRAQENSSIKGQAGRELQLIDAELVRRGLSAAKKPGV